MADTKKFTARDARQISAFEYVEGFGPGYFNSLIGDSPAQTCKKVEAVMPFLMHVTDNGEAGLAVDLQPVMSFLVQSVWTAVQYEGFLSAADEGDTNV